MQIFTKKGTIIGVFVVLSILTLSCMGLAYYFYDTKPVCENNQVFSDIEEEVVEEEQFYVEIKGAVNTPGVYLVTENEIINDVITLAGGLKKNAYTNNINLSKSVTKEMVIYVYTTSEIKKNVSYSTTSCTTSSYTIDNCTSTNSSVIETTSAPSSTSTTTSSDTSSTISTIVNINTATLEELTTLSGIGTTKAQAIITYRTEHGNFTQIEDLKNVSGIGDSTFEKIKANITI